MIRSFPNLQKSNRGWGGRDFIGQREGKKKSAWGMDMLVKEGMVFNFGPVFGY